MTPAAAVAAALAPLADRGMARLGIAVSGGGDSMALLALAADWAVDAGVTLAAATVDHRLRPEAAAEATMVATAAARLGIAHDTLTWTVWDGRGNLQAAARRARHRLLADWAAWQGIGHVALAHTLDDQAETVLLRLARGSGVDGLAAMAPVRTEPGGPVWLRPLLGIRRAALREVLVHRGMDWVEDPSNADGRFDRVRARELLASGALPGLEPGRLAATAARMAAARQVLAGVACDAAVDLAEVEHGAVSFARDGFAALPDDTRWRLLAAALRRVSGQVYRPRLDTLRRAEAAALAGGRLTLLGCVVSGGRDRLCITREPAALAGQVAPVPGAWDGRWQVEGPGGEDLATEALRPADLARIPDWRAAGIPRGVLLASPAIRRAGTFVAAPLLDSTLRRASPWSARPLWGKLEFCADLVSD